MKNRFLFIFFLSTLCCAFYSCSHNNSVKKTIDEVLRIGDKQPQKALCILDSIKDLDKMSEDNRMSYIIVHTWIKYKLNKDISKDTLIYKAADYFKKRNNPQMNMLSNFYSAAVCKANKQQNKEFEYNLNSLLYAEELKDSTMLSKTYFNLGWIYVDNDLEDSAAVYLNKSIDYATSDTLRLRAITVLAYLYNNSNKLNKLAELTAEGSLIINNIQQPLEDELLIYSHIVKSFLGTNYKKQQKYNEAIQIFSELEREPLDSLRTVTVYINMAQIYNKKNLSNTDSLGYYSLKAEAYLPILPSSNKYIYSRKVIFSLLSEYYESIGDKEQALIYENKESSIFKDYEVVRNQQKVLFNINQEMMLSTQKKSIDKQYKNLFLGGTIVLFCIIAFVAIAAHHAGIKEEKRIVKNSIEYFDHLKRILKE